MIFIWRRCRQLICPTQKKTIHLCSPVQVLKRYVTQTITWFYLSSLISIVSGCDLCLLRCDLIRLNHQDHFVSILSGIAGGHFHSLLALLSFKIPALVFQVPLLQNTLGPWTHQQRFILCTRIVYITLKLGTQLVCAEVNSYHEICI